MYHKTLKNSGIEGNLENYTLLCNPKTMLAMLALVTVRKKSIHLELLIKFIGPRIVFAVSVEIYEWVAGQAIPMVGQPLMLCVVDRVHDLHFCINPNQSLANRPGSREEKPWAWSREEPLI